MTSTLLATNIQTILLLTTILNIQNILQLAIIIYKLNYY